MNACAQHDVTLSIAQQVKVIKGQDSFLKYKSSDPLTRHMCDTCGCHMFGELSGDTPIIVSTCQSAHLAMAKLHSSLAFE